MDPNGCDWNSFKNKVGNWFRKAGRWIQDKIINPIKNFIKNDIGAAIQYGLERVTDIFYYFLITIEGGLGYSKSFDNNKPINFYINMPEKWWEFWKFSVGIDINYNGWGVGINIGGETSLTFHMGRHSLEFFANIARVGVKWYTQDSLGNYYYSKFSLNLPEIAITVLLIKITKGLVIPIISSVKR